MSRRKERVAPAADLALVQQFLRICPDNAVYREDLAPLYHCDAIFVAIDFEGEEGSEHKHGISQIGVSTLDTRDLPCASSLGQSLIKSQLYCVSKRPKSRRLDGRTRKIFTFGEVIWIRKPELVDTLVTIFENFNTYSSLGDDLRRPRNVVLVGHALDNELMQMEILGFQPELHARIIAHVDTQNLSDEIRGHRECASLRSLVHQVGMNPKQMYEAGALPKARHFHNAGNDAAYTLEVLLLLAVSNHQEAVNASRAGWITLTKLSITEAIALVSSNIGDEDQTVNLQLLTEISQAVSKSDLLQPPVMKEKEKFAPAFLLAVARWKMMKQFDDTDGRSVLEKFDEIAQLVVRSDAYRTAICALPIYFALAPPWHLHSDRH